MLPLPFPKSTISLGYGAVDGVYYTRQSPHQGTDFSSRSQGVTSGSVIRASGPGTVVRQGVGPAGVSPSMGRPNSKSGNSIDVDYGNVVVRYMHRPYNSPSPATGSRVYEGTEIGVIGNTGLSGGPHLHMEAWDKRTRTRVDPARFFDFNRTVTTGNPAADTSKPFVPITPEMIQEDPMRYALILHVSSNQLLVVDMFEKKIVNLGNNEASGVRAYYSMMKYAKVEDAEWEKNFPLKDNKNPDGFTYVFSAK